MKRATVLSGRHPSGWSSPGAAGTAASHSVGGRSCPFIRRRGRSVSQGNGSFLTVACGSQGSAGFIQTFANFPGAVSQ
jgi:hypothetical protein